MNLFKRELEKEYKAIGFKSLRKIEKVSRTQKGKSIKSKDISKEALPPGKRRSKLGKIYYEYRKNRSDLPGESI